MDPARRRRRITLLAMGLLWLVLTGIAQNTEGGAWIRWAADRAIEGTKAIDPFFLCGRFFEGLAGPRDPRSFLDPPKPPSRYGPVTWFVMLFHGLKATFEGVRDAGWPALLPALVSLLPAIGLWDKKWFGEVGLPAFFVYPALTILLGGVLALALKWTLWAVFSLLGSSAALVVYASPVILAIEWIRSLYHTGSKVGELATPVATPPDPAPAAPGLPEG